MRLDGAEIVRKAVEAVDIPADAVQNLPRVTLTGVNRVFVENHKGLLGYGEEEMIINGGRVIIKLRGHGLGLKAMTERELEVSGTLTSLEYLPWGSEIG